MGDGREAALGSTDAEPESIEPEMHGTPVPVMVMMRAAEEERWHRLHRRDALVELSPSYRRPLCLKHTRNISKLITRKGFKLELSLI